MSEDDIYQIRNEKVLVASIKPGSFISRKSAKEIIPAEESEILIFLILNIIQVVRIL